MQPVLTRLPGQVERVDWDTVPAQTWPRIVRGKSKGFGRSGIDHLEDIDTHTVRDHFHFIDQADIHGTMNVFQQLGHFCSFC